MSITSPSTLDVALACLDAGLCVLPATRRGETKRPAVRSWKPYQRRRPSPEELLDLFQQSAATALCIVCGAVSGDVEMIDFDLGGEAFDPWREAVESAAPGLVARLTIESTPSGGRHVVYRCEHPVAGNAKLAQRRIEVCEPGAVVIGPKEYVPHQDAGGAWIVVVTTIETRGEGGLFLCAPSEGYQLIQGDLTALPLIAAEEREVLLGCAMAMNELLPTEIVGRADRSPAASSAAARPGDDFNRRGDVRELLIRHGWRRTREGDNEYWCRPGKASGTSATLKDGVLYVFSTNAAPFEPQKGYAPFAVYALLEHRGDFSAAASSLAGVGYGISENGHVDAPKSDVDLSHLLPCPAAEQGPGQPHAPLSSPSSQGFTPKYLWAPDLLTTYPRLHAPIIDGVLREGEIMNIIAAPKTGKSWAVLDLAVMIATGRPWLERYYTRPGRVLILDNELHGATSAHRLPKVTEARGVKMSELKNRLAIDNLRGRTEDIERLASYFQSLEPGLFKVIVLDAFYRFMPPDSDENDNGTMTTIYNHLDRYASQLKCSFILIHHSSKGSQASKSVTDVGAGAGAQSRATDTHLVLRPHEEDDVIVLDAAVRSFPPLKPICLRWSFPVWNLDLAMDPSALRGGASSSAKSKKAKEEAPPRDLWTLNRFVEVFLSEKPASKAQIREAVKDDPVLSWRRVNDYLDLAEEKGLIHRWKVGRAHKAFYATAPPPTVFDGGETS